VSDAPHSTLAAGACNHFALQNYYKFLICANKWKKNDANDEMMQMMKLKNERVRE
jgi:hypothetical protein